MTISSNTHNNKGLFELAIRSRMEEIKHHAILISVQIKKTEDPELQEALNDAYNIMMMHGRELGEWTFWQGGGMKEIEEMILKEMEENHECKTQRSTG